MAEVNVASDDENQKLMAGEEIPEKTSGDKKDGTRWVCRVSLDS